MFVKFTLVAVGALAGVAGAKLTSARHNRRRHYPSAFPVRYGDPGSDHDRLR